MVSRVLAASIGGYAVVSLLTVAWSLLLPLPRPTAVVAATMASFAVYAAVVMAVFSVRTATRAWLVLAAAALPAAVVVWWLGR